VLVWNIAKMVVIKEFNGKQKNSTIFTSDQLPDIIEMNEIYISKKRLVGWQTWSSYSH